MPQLISTLPRVPQPRVVYRTEGLPTVVQGFRSYHFCEHALQRAEEMDLSFDTIVEALTQGVLTRNTPRSAHYKDGKGWLARHGSLSVGLLENGPWDFTVTTVLWRDAEMWDRWFEREPATDRKHRPRV